MQTSKCRQLCRAQATALERKRGGEDREMQHRNTITYRQPAHIPNCGGQSFWELPLLGSSSLSRVLLPTCLYSSSPWDRVSPLKIQSSQRIPAGQGERPCSPAPAPALLFLLCSCSCLAAPAPAPSICRGSTGEGKCKTQITELEIREIAKLWIKFRKIY